MTGPNHAPQSSPANDPGAALFRGHVLLVEDNPVSALIAQTELQSLQLQVSHAIDGKTALGMFANRQYDLVLMDCEMPEMDGYEATRRMRQLERADGRLRTPVVALTAHAQKGDREACMARGMDGYVSKPIIHDVLTQTLATFLPPAKANYLTKLRFTG